MKRNVILGVLAWLCACLPATTIGGLEPTGQTLHICDGVAEWPPYTYFQRVDGKKTDTVVGFSVDVAREILGRQGYDFTIDKKMPWNRCIQSVQEGTEYQMVLNASRTEERVRDFFMSDAYYDLRTGYFYSKTHHPQGLQIGSGADANKYRICGILGYLYNYPGIDVSKVDTGARTHVQLIAKLEKNRCDLFLEYYDVLAGSALTGDDLLTGADLDWKPLPGAEPDHYHIMVSRAYPDAENLIEILNQGIAKMKASGKLESLKQKNSKPQ